MRPDPQSSPIREIEQADFESEVLGSPRPVLVAFSAPWSRPCHILDPALNTVATACAGRVKVVRVNADEYPELSLWYGVQSIPTLLFFERGTLRDRVVGTASPEAILAKLSSAVASLEPSQPPATPRDLPGASPADQPSEP